MPSPEPTAVSSLQAPPAQFDLPGLEEGILQLWKDNDVEGRSLQQGAAAARGEGDDGPSGVSAALGRKG